MAKVMQKKKHFRKQNKCIRFFGDYHNSTKLPISINKIFSSFLVNPLIRSAPILLWSRNINKYP